MLKFKNMRQRVEFAYDEMNVDIYYEGDFKYSLLDHSTESKYEFVDEEQLDKVLNIIWHNEKR